VFAEKPLGSLGEHRRLVLQEDLTGSSGSDVAVEFGHSCHGKCDLFCELLSIHALLSTILAESTILLHALPQAKTKVW